MSGDSNVIFMGANLNTTASLWYATWNGTNYTSKFLIIISSEYKLLIILLYVSPNFKIKFPFLF